MITEPPRGVTWEVPRVTYQAHLKNSMDQCGQALLLLIIVL